MSDRRKTTPTPEPPPPADREPDTDLPALREIYVCQLRQEERDKLEGLCESVLELTREADAIAREINCGAVDDDLRAAAADLRHVERYLRWTGASEGNVLERWESRLCDLAERLAPKVGEVAAELEAAVAANPRE